MTLRPFGRSTKQVASRFIGGSWNCGKAPGFETPLVPRFKALHTIGGSGYPSSRGRISSVATLRERTRYTIPKTLGISRFSDPWSRHSPSSPLYPTFSTSSPPNKKEDDGKDGSSATEVAKPDTSFKSMFRQYGMVFIGTYFSVYVTTVVSLFMAVQSGQVDAMYIISLLTGTSAPAEPGGVADPETIQEAATAMKDLVELMESHMLSRPFAPIVEANPWTANFAIAWIATKFTEPIRLGATVVLTPSVAKFFGYKPISSIRRRKGSKDKAASK